MVSQDLVRIDNLSAVGVRDEETIRWIPGDKFCEGSLRNAIAQNKDLTGTLKTYASTSR